MFNKAPEVDRFNATQLLIETLEALALAVAEAKRHGSIEMLQSDPVIKKYREDTESGLIFRTMASAWFNRREMRAYEDCLRELVSAPNDPDHLDERALGAFDKAIAIVTKAFMDGREEDPFDRLRAYGFAGYASEEGEGWRFHKGFRETLLELYPWTVPQMEIVVFEARKC